MLINYFWFWQNPIDMVETELKDGDDILYFFN